MFLIEIKLSGVDGVIKTEMQLSKLTEILESNNLFISFIDQNNICYLINKLKIEHLRYEPTVKDRRIKQIPKKTTCQIDNQKIHSLKYVITFLGLFRFNSQCRKMNIVRRTHARRRFF